MSPHSDSLPGHHHADIDWEVLATQLENRGELHLPVFARTAARLRELIGPEQEVRRTLDIGSGPGVDTCVLAEAFAGAEVVALDAAAGLLDRAVARADPLGLRGMVSVRHAELPEGLTVGDAHRENGLGTADLIWSSRAVHHLGDQQGAMDDLRACFGPADCSRWKRSGCRCASSHATSVSAGRGCWPGSTPPRRTGSRACEPNCRAAPPSLRTGWLCSAAPGSPALAVFSSLLDLPAPLGETARAFLHAHLTRLRDAMSESLEEQDVTTLDVLLDPAAADSILRRPDAFLLSATTVFTAVHPACPQRRTPLARERSTR